MIQREEESMSSSQRRLKHEAVSDDGDEGDAERGGDVALGEPFAEDGESALDVKSTVVSSSSTFRAGNAATSKSIAARVSALLMSSLLVSGIRCAGGAPAIILPRKNKAIGGSAQSRKIGVAAEKGGVYRRIRRAVRAADGWTA
jgi:hypothetical protein